MKNKKGTDKILSIYWFLILTIVAGGIFAMVYAFYGPPYDIRDIESEIFAQKIADCISQKGLIDPYFIDRNGFNQEISANFKKRCNFNFNVEENYEGIIQYFYKVEFYTPKETFTPTFIFEGGNLNWESECFVKKENGKEYLRLAECNERRFYSLSASGDQYLIKILSVIGKSEKNARK